MSDPPDARRSAVDAEVSAFRRSGAIIEQAKGVLVQLLAVEEAQAFAVLSRYSQDRNVRIVDLAARLVDAASRGKTPSTNPEMGAVLELLDDLSGPEPGRS